MKRTCLILLGTMLLTGCSIHQHAEPVTLSPELAPTICMIPAPGVRSGFTATYRSALQDKGFTVRELASGTSAAACPLATTYTAKWSWDLALYMSYAEMRVFEQGVQAGMAIYDARSGGGRLDKFIDAEPKIRELADRLFPNGSAGLSEPDAIASSIQKEQDVEMLKQALREQKISYEEYRLRYRNLTRP